jgi:hypothetical protein
MVVAGIPIIKVMENQRVKRRLIVLKERNEANFEALRTNIDVHGIEIEETAPSRFINALTANAGICLHIAVGDVIMLEIWKRTHKISTSDVLEGVRRQRLNLINEICVICNSSVDVVNSRLSDLVSKIRTAGTRHGLRAVANVAAFTRSGVIAGFWAAGIIVVILRILCISRAQRILRLIIA